MEASGSHARERRRSARHVVQDVNGILHLSADAKIVNMSLTGMAVETHAQLRVGRTYSLSLRHGDDHTLHLSGTVVWCHLRGLRKSGSTETRPVYEAGIQFDEALTKTAADLTRILQAAAVIAVEKRISGRFTVDMPEPVNLDATYPFEVKTISTVGILIEADVSLPVDAVIEVHLDLRDYRLRTKGRIAHASELAGPSGHKISRLGVEFLEISSGDRRAVADFIARHIKGVTADDAPG